MRKMQKKTYETCALIPNDFLTEQVEKGSKEQLAKLGSTKKWVSEQR